MTQQNLETQMQVNPYESSVKNFDSDSKKKRSDLFTHLVSGFIGATAIAYLDLLNYSDNIDITPSYLTKFMMDLF